MTPSPFCFHNQAGMSLPYPMWPDFCFLSQPRTSLSQKRHEESSSAAAASLQSSTAELTVPLFLLNNPLWIPRAAKTFWEPLTQHSDGHTEGVVTHTDGLFLTVAPKHFTQAASEV